ALEPLRGARTLPDALHERLAGDRCQRLAREAGRGEAGGNDADGAHARILAARRSRLGSRRLARLHERLPHPRAAPRAALSSAAPATTFPPVSPPDFLGAEP